MHECETTQEGGYSCRGQVLERVRGDEDDVDALALDPAAVIRSVVFVSAWHLGNGMRSMGVPKVHQGFA